MKSIVITFFLLACISFISIGQIKVKQNGNMYLNDHELFVHDNSGSSYGFGYGAYGASQMCIFSDNLIDFRESDNDILCVQFKLNDRSTDFYGNISFNKNSWTGGIRTNIVNFDGYNMASIYPNLGWWGTLGTQEHYFGAAYIEHIYAKFYDNWPSDRRLKENIRPITGSLDKITRLQPVKYDIIASYYDSISGGAKEKLIKNSKNLLGFIAQDVKEIVPEIVHLEPTTKYYGISTVDLIPLLVQAIKEQQKQIETLQNIVTSHEEEIISLKQQISNTNVEGSSSTQKSAHVSTGFGISETGNQESGLFQNIPNPFRHDTEIRYRLAANAQNAKLFIYDLQGKEIKSFILSGDGLGSVVIKGNELDPGMYIYSLVIDKKLIDKKRMILTK